MDGRISLRHQEGWGPIIDHSAPLVVIGQNAAVPSAPPIPDDEWDFNDSLISMEENAPLKGRVDTIETLKERPMSMCRKVVLVIFGIFTLGIGPFAYFQTMQEEFNNALLKQDLKAAQAALDKGASMSSFSKRLSRKVIEAACRNASFREFLISQPLLKAELKRIVSQMYFFFENHIYLDDLIIKEFEDIMPLLKSLIEQAELTISDLSPWAEKALKYSVISSGTSQSFAYLVAKDFIRFKRSQ